MESLFLGLFLTGLTFVVLSFLLGFAHVHVHIPGAAHVHLHFPGAGRFHLGHPSINSPARMESDLSPLNFSTAMTFIAWFGGVGYILTLRWQVATLLVLLVATLSGLAGATIVFLALVKLLLPGQTAPMRAEDYRMEGTLARVTLPVGGTRIGEIVYVKHGTTRSEGARSLDGSPLPRDSEVVVMKYDRGIAYVSPLESLLAERASREPPPGLEESRSHRHENV